MSVGNFNEEAVFTAARQISDPAARDAFLRKKCLSEEMRIRLLTLLEIHDQEQSFLKSPAEELLPTEIRPVVSEKPGMLIGRYKLLEKIGEGGCGIVFMAEQTVPVRRKVAFKVIKPGMDTKQVIARFEAERQALALMDHPNIARVFDAGATESGRPFFVMELVRGFPITRFCDDHCLATQERLKLFIDICQAVQHAHQKGIIHRDLKPSNILIAMQDGRAVVKVIDFGIAKATGQQLLTDKTLFTGFAQMVGTPLYMSPEQSELSSIDIDTRSDIYSLGVLLYELLTGTTPFDRQRMKDAALEELRRIIREEEPPKPSTRLSSLTDSLPSIAAQRKLDPRKLCQQLKGDLDWIIMKSLEKDRARRYETADGFARDIERYLAHEPVQARAPSTWYRFQKLLRRNRWTISAAGLVAFCLCVVTGVALYHAQQQHELADSRRDLADDRKAALQEAEQARRETETKLYHALLGRAAAVRTARLAGYRNEAWEYLHEAAGLEAEPRGMEDIRREVLASLGDPVGLSAIDYPVVEFQLKDKVPEAFRKIVEDARGDVRRCIAVSSDGRLLADWNLEDGLIRIRNDNNEVGRSTVPLGPVHALEFTPDSNFLVGGCEAGMVVWSVSHLSVNHTISGDVIRDVAIHPGGQQIATLNRARKIEVFSLGSHRMLATFSAPPTVEQIVFDSDGALLLGIAGPENVVRTAWSINRTPEKQYLYGHQGAVTGVAFNSDGSLLATGSKDRSIGIWDVATGQRLHDCRGHGREVEQVIFDKHRNVVISGGWDHTIRVWDAANGRELAVGHDAGQIWSLSFDASGDLLVTGAYHQIDCWQLTTASGEVKLNHLRKIEMPSVADATVDPAGKSVAFHSWGKGLYLLDLSNTSSKLQHLKVSNSNSYETLSFDPTGEFLHFVTKRGTAGLWDVRKAALVKESTNPIPFNHHAYSPDQRWFAGAHDDGVIRLYDGRDFREVLALPPESQKPWGLAWSPDGTRLAACLPDGAAVIWNLEEVRARLNEFDIVIPSTRVAGRSGQFDLTQPSWIKSGNTIPAETRWKRGVAAMGSKEYSDAEQEFRTLVELDDNSGKYHAWLGAALYEQRRIAEALVELERAKSLGWDDYLLSYTLGRSKADLGDLRGAALAYENAWHKQPGDLNAANCSIHAYLGAGEGKAAERICRQLVEQYRRIQDSTAARGALYTLLMDADLASDSKILFDLLKVIESAGRDDAKRLRGAVLYRNGEFALALEEFKADEERASRAWDYIFRAMTHHQLGQTAEALNWLRLSKQWIEEANTAESEGPPKSWYGWYDKIEVSILFEEAEALIMGNPATP